MTEERIKQEIRCIVCLKDVSRGSVNTNFPPIINLPLPFCSQECMEKVENALLCREEFEKEKLKADVEKANLFEGGQKFERQKIYDNMKKLLEGYSNFDNWEDHDKFGGLLDEAYNKGMECEKQKITGIINQKIEELNKHLEEVEIKEPWIYKELYDKTQQKLEILQQLLEAIK